MAVLVPYIVQAGDTLVAILASQECDGVQHRCGLPVEEAELQQGKTVWLAFPAKRAILRSLVDAECTMRTHAGLMSWHDLEDVKSQCVDMLMLIGDHQRRSL